MPESAATCPHIAADSGIRRSTHPIAKAFSSRDAAVWTSVVCSSQLQMTSISQDSEKSKSPLELVDHIVTIETSPTVRLGAETDSPAGIPPVSRKRGSAIHAAAWEGDTSLLGEMLQAGEDPDSGDEWNLTPIMSTLMRHSLQDTRCVFNTQRETIQRNLVMDCREEDAARAETTSAVLKLLLRYGADPDARTNGRKTALHYATSDGLFEAATILLDAGAAIDAQDQDGQSPLFCAVQERSLLVTNLLVRHGASIDLQDKSGVSPLSLVVEKGYVDVVQIFMNHYALVATRGRLDFAGEVLLQAVEANSEAIVRFLVESGDAALDYQNDAGETAMHCAIAKGATHMMETLRALDTAGKCLHAVTSRGESYFHVAARVASVHELEILLRFLEQVSEDEKRDLLNKPDAGGATPLFTAATTTDSSCTRDHSNSFADRHDKLKLLLSNGALLLRTEALPGGSPFRRSSQGSAIILCAKVRRCLIQWFEECQDESEGEMLREFSTKWIAHVPSTRESATILSMLSLCVCSGYTLEVLPLLLMLPQEQAAITSFLQSLDVFECCSNGLQFECLARELREAWVIKS